MKFVSFMAFFQGDHYLLCKPCIDALIINQWCRERARGCPENALNGRLHGVQLFRDELASVGIVLRVEQHIAQEVAAALVDGQHNFGRIFHMRRVENPFLDPLRNNLRIEWSDHRMLPLDHRVQ